jgi:hypothetical protein
MFLNQFHATKRSKGIVDGYECELRSNRTKLIFFLMEILFYSQLPDISPIGFPRLQMIASLAVVQSHQLVASHLKPQILHNAQKSVVNT